MRRRPDICDACVRLRQRADPDAETSMNAWVPYCGAFPDRVPAAIYTGGFDHREPFEGDGGVRFEMRPGGERALASYERVQARKRAARQGGGG